MIEILIFYELLKEFHPILCLDPCHKRLEDSKFEAACETERKKKLRISSKEFKKRRLMLKEKRRSSNELNELQEGDTYASGIELRNDKEVEDEIIPTYVPLPSDERIKQAENLLFVSVDLEISTSDHNAEVTHLPIWT